MGKQYTGGVPGKIFAKEIDGYEKKCGDASADVHAAFCVCVLRRNNGTGDGSSG